MGFLFLAVPVLGLIITGMAMFVTLIARKSRIWFAASSFLGIVTVVTGGFAFWIGAWTIGISSPSFSIYYIPNSISDFPTEWALYFLGVFCLALSITALGVGTYQLIALVSVDKDATKTSRRDD